MEIFWSEPAEKDVSAIVAYIARDNVAAALELDDLLRNAADSLAAFPEKGKPGRVPGTRELVAHKNYIIVYTVFASAVYTVAVAHAARQWP